jgi:hypothetical protein
MDTRSIPLGMKFVQMGLLGLRTPAGGRREGEDVMKMVCPGLRYTRTWFRKGKVHCGSPRETKAGFGRRAGDSVHTLVDEDFENWR